MLIDSVPPARAALRAARADRVGGEGNRLKTGGTEAIDRHGRNFNRQTGSQARDAGNVCSLLGLGHRAAENDILDFTGIERRHAIESAAYRSGGEIVRTSSGELPFGALPTAVRTAAAIKTSVMMRFLRFDHTQAAKQWLTG